MEKDIGKQDLSKIALKNSSYNLLAVFVLKFGGLIFTIIIARLLLPELFGIYALTLSILTIFLVFTDLGTNKTFLRYFSDALGKRKVGKARTYLKYLLRIKFVLVFVTVVALFFLSKFLAYDFYNKPLLFYPLLFACLFVLTESLKDFIGNIFVATKNMKPIPFLEICISVSLFVITNEQSTICV